MALVQEAAQAAAFVAVMLDRVRQDAGDQLVAIKNNAI
jgi:hypothetical protein